MTGISWLLIIMLSLGGAGSAIGLLYQRKCRRTAEAELQAKIIEVTVLREKAAQAGDLSSALEGARAENIALKQAQSALEARLEEREKAFEAAQQGAREQFQHIARQTVSAAHDDFLKRANETFAKHQTTALAQSDDKHQKIDALLKPMQETLTRYEDGLRLMREAQSKDQGALSEQLSALATSTRLVQSEAAKLTTALKTSPNIRGNWGEIQLRNIVEAAGLSPYADFEIQKSITTETGLGRPDLVLRLPGERQLIIDAKISINAHLDAAEADSDEERMAYMAKHAKEVWSHVSQLSSKDYASGFKAESSLGFVVMFLGGEGLLQAALEARPNLIQEALDKKILITTPASLAAMLKLVSYLWREEKANANAREVAGLAADLYKSLKMMVTHLDGLGKNLGGSIQKYNAVIGNIETRVLPRARKFRDYEMPGTEQEIEILVPVGTGIRALDDSRN